MAQNSFAITPDVLRALMKIKAERQRRKQGGNLMDKVDPILRTWDGFPRFCEEQIRIAPMEELPGQEGLLIPMKLKFNQIQVLETERQLRDQGKHPWMLVLKFRKVGITTLQQALSFWTIWREKHRNCVTLAHRDGDTRMIFRMVQRFYENQPEAFRHQKTEAWVNNLEYPGWDSLYIASTAGRGGAGRGSTFDRVHLSEAAHFPALSDVHTGISKSMKMNAAYVIECLDADTAILLANGDIRRIVDVKPGDLVRTHTGASAPVVKIVETPAANLKNHGETLQITSWLNSAFPVIASPDHPFWTQRGWVWAQDLTTSDEIGTPIRPLVPSISTISYPERAIDGKHRRFYKPAPPIPLTRETGFAFGFYLAEGHIRYGHSSERHATAIGLTHDVAETDTHAARAARALDLWTTFSSSYRRKNSRTTETVLRGAGLARIVEEEFGAGDEKRIPDWVWSSSREFMEGILEGYVVGDGCKTIGSLKGKYDNITVVIPSVRVSLLLQVRDMLATLGMGWGGITYMPAKSGAGRNNREKWALSISGQAAIALRKLVGFDIDPNREPRIYSNKYRIENDTVWVRVRKIEEGPHRESLFGIALTHDDHSFVLPLGATHNTTPNGKEGDGQAFYEMWQSAKRGDSRFCPIFIPWFSDPKNVLAIKDPDELKDPDTFSSDDPTKRQLAGLDDEEQQLVKRHNLTVEQIKWWREEKRGIVADGGSKAKIHQEHPSDDESCFLSSTASYFDVDYINDLEKIAEREGVALKPSEVPDHPVGETNMRSLVEAGRLVLYELPDPGKAASYIFGIDPAGGVGQDDSALVGFNATTGRQALRYTYKRQEPFEFGRQICAGLGWQFFNHSTGLPAYLVVELNNHGGSTLDGIIKGANYPRERIYHHTPPLRVGKDGQPAPAGPMPGWINNALTKQQLTRAVHRILAEQVPLVIDVKTVSSIRNVPSGPNGPEFKGKDLAVAAGLAALAMAGVTEPSPFMFIGGQIIQLGR